MREYLRWKPRWRRTGRQIVVQSVLSGVIFTLLMTVFDALSGWEEVSVLSTAFRFTFFTLFIIGFGFLFNPKQAPPASQSQSPTAGATPAARPGG